jgi:hypothetical protein
MEVQVSELQLQMIGHASAWYSYAGNAFNNQKKSTSSLSLRIPHCNLKLHFYSAGRTGFFVIGHG